MKAAFLWSELFRRGGYGRHHPLAIPRVPLTYDLLRSFDAFAPGEVVGARPASRQELLGFHAADYVDAYQAAEAAGRVDADVRSRYQLGTLENPYFEGFFTIPAVAAGASVQGAELVLEGRAAFNPAGGMHHARAAAAHGFCFFNDPVLGILLLRGAGWRVLYVDIDAHHGDGVEEAFRGDPSVLTLSLHMDTAYAYPYRRSGDERAINVPLPPGVHDMEYQLLFDTVWYPALERFCPDAVVLQAGADALFCDPLAKLRLTTQGFLAVVSKIIDSAPRHGDGTPRLLVLGGGGYHPLATARTWCGLWALLAGRDLPDAIPPEGAQCMRQTGWNLDEDEAYFPRLFQRRTDAPLDLPIRAEIRALAGALRRHL